LGENSCCDSYWGFSGQPGRDRLTNPAVDSSNGSLGWFFAIFCISAISTKIYAKPSISLCRVVSLSTHALIKFKPPKLARYFLGRPEIKNRQMPGSAAASAGHTPFAVLAIRGGGVILMTFMFQNVVITEPFYSLKHS